MIPTLLEGVDSIRLPCSWVLLIPGAALVVFGRRRTVLVAAVFVSLAILTAWLRFAGWWFEAPRGVTQIILGIVIIAVSAIAWKRDEAASDALLAAVVGVAASWTWIPCVGPKLGEVLNGARTQPLDHFGGTVAFLVGQFVPLLALVAVGHVWPTLDRRLQHPAVVTGGAILLGTIGLLYTTTLFDDLASELARRSAY